ncbi:uncharacterized protein LOC124308861 isoform X2 [Neodiprion virginianus]|uniref:uncharacterized protein LOC124308861 isoform X2 n=1 Tax=Neodiprion virginianus TaxID=2961670 RepID=UPI001EE780C6|nr:uncharacterized protein LOC124308861 isoform X2 [Neodiprion virginianus]
MDKRPADSRRDQTSQQKSGHSSNTANSNSNNSHNHHNNRYYIKKSKRRNSKKGTGSSPQTGELSQCVESRHEQEQQQLNSQQKSYISALANSAAKTDYGKIYWQQSPLQQQLRATQNSQRLFTAASDPAVCGYSPMPLTYAMEPVSLPPMYQLFQPVPRPSYHSYHGRGKQNHAQGASGILGGKMTPPFNHLNGYSSLQENNVGYSIGVGYQNGDYTSLPPAANIQNGVAAQELGSEHRRYSDPGLGPLEIPKFGKSDDSESIDSGSSGTTVGRSNKLVLSLIEQVTALKESNSQLFKELHQTKAELETVKMELTRLKQSSFADYQPGMLSDIVREMREAAKVREESLISKVKSMMNEKQPFSSIPDTSTTELDELKNQLARITDEKTKTEVRLAKVEQELAALKSSANDEGQEIVALEEETLALRRELQEAMASRNKAQNQASKLEQLVGILRKKTNGSSVEDIEAGPGIRHLVTSSSTTMTATSMNDNIHETTTTTTTISDGNSSSADPRSPVSSISLNNSSSGDESSAFEPRPKMPTAANANNKTTGTSDNCGSINFTTSLNSSGPVTDL